MFNRFLNLLEQDIKIALRNYFHIVILGLGMIFILLVNFVLPSEMKLTPSEVFFDASEGGILKGYLEGQGMEPSRIYTNRQALMDEVAANSQVIGIVMEGTLDEPRFFIYHQGNEAQETLNIFDASLETILSELRGEPLNGGFSVETLRAKTEPIPFHRRVVPLIIVLEAVMLGFLLIAVMVFQDKEEGGVRAYRVSPGGTVEYILSKAVVNILLAVCYTVLIVLFTVGARWEFLFIIPLVALASLLMTLVGLSVSVFFKSIEEFLFVGVFIMTIIGLPMVSYMNPSFAPAYLTMLPSYSVLFGLRDILFTSGKWSAVGHLMWTLSLQTILFFFISYLAVKTKLMREGR